MTAITEKPTGSRAEFYAHNQPPPPRSRVRVWLTDDNIGFRNMLVHLLDRAGEFECERQFHSAESLLGGLAEGPVPDVILLDIEMGGMTGVDALRPIRALAPNARVLIVTTFFDPMYETRASRDGASAFLLKAFAVQNIVEEIHRALASPVPLQKLATVDSIPVPAHRTSGDPKPRLGSEFVSRKSLVARLALWMTHISNTLFGPMEYHRPATPK
jgi:DNA-binding NarL/FixJ family response regulator